MQLHGRKPKMATKEHGIQTMNKGQPQCPYSKMLTFKVSNGSLYEMHCSTMHFPFQRKGYVMSRWENWEVGSSAINFTLIFNYHVQQGMRLQSVQQPHLTLYNLSKVSPQKRGEGGYNSNYWIILRVLKYKNGVLSLSKTSGKPLEWENGTYLTSPTLRNAGRLLYLRKYLLLAYNTAHGLNFCTLPHAVFTRKFQHHVVDYWTAGDSFKIPSLPKVIFPALLVIGFCWTQRDVICFPVSSYLCACNKAFKSSLVFLYHQ